MGVPTRKWIKLNRCSNYLKKKKTEKLQNFLSKHLFFREILRICFDRIMLKKKKEFVQYKFERVRFSFLTKRIYIFSVKFLTNYLCSKKIKREYIQKKQKL